MESSVAKIPEPDKTRWLQNAPSVHHTGQKHTRTTKYIQISKSEFVRTRVDTAYIHANWTPGLGYEFLRTEVAPPDCFQLP